MTTWNLFQAILGALLVRDLADKIIGEISYYFHRKKYGSILDYINKPEDTE